MLDIQSFSYIQHYNRAIFQKVKRVYFNFLVIYFSSWVIYLAQLTVLALPFFKCFGKFPPSFHFVLLFIHVKLHIHIFFKSFFQLFNENSHIFYTLWVLLSVMEFIYQNNFISSWRILEFFQQKCTMHYQFDWYIHC